MSDAVCVIGSDQTGISLFVRLTPKASRNAIGDVVADASGQMQLRVSVTAVPENGKANQALIKLLAKAAKCPKSSIRIVSGLTDRNKKLLIDGDPDELMVQISQLTGRTDR
ncbi:MULTISPECIES: DUF167 family protein [Thalassospira]|jgi:uncharacterized protein|uniref:DUF167 family protein n=1 Tax=Thalassospira TaxID=168934 RepID=UPI00048AF351|nr:MULTISPECIES: DUF167 family protein [Thalassospira]MBV17465.1 hypothetical protein [Thalassospira sp.]RCK29876.1 hypothetical protein TH1_03300 [Thalassospira lucentensis MCCC 1A00383 = DSM 14000]|tara:strand:- start:1583 stop:1915 length:333 start_codon:yes stop_codon:yes gene_type:complete